MTTPLCVRLELMAQTMTGREHRRLRCLLREAVIELTRMEPEKRPRVEYATTSAKIRKLLNERGPLQYSEIRDATGLNRSTIQMCIRNMIERGQINTTDSTTKNGPVRAARVYSTPEWDRANGVLRVDWASSWMRNPVMEDEAA